MGPNRTTKVTQVVFLERLAALALRDAKAVRAELALDAAAEYAEQGTAATWRIPDVATVSAGVTHEAAYVRDQAAWSAWVADRYPTEAERVTVVRPAWQSTYLSSVLTEPGPDGEYVAIDPRTGERLPGVGVRPGGEFNGLTIRVSAAAKEVFDALASDRLALLELEATKPVVLAEVSDASE